MSDLPTLRARVEAAQSLAAKATPGPWAMQGAQSDYMILHPTGSQDGWAIGPVVLEIDIRDERHVSSPDADLMAAAPGLVTLATDLLALAESQAIERDAAVEEVAVFRREVAARHERRKATHGFEADAFADLPPDEQAAKLRALLAKTAAELDDCYEAHSQMASQATRAWIARATAQGERDEARDEAKSADIHRNLNRRIAEAMDLTAPRIDPEHPDWGEYLPSWHDIPERVMAMRAELDAIRAALGNGADEAAWPPGLTLAEAVGRLLREHHSLRDVLQWTNDQCPGKCSAVCDAALRPGGLCNAVVSERPKLSGFTVRTLCPLPAGHEGPHAEALGAGDEVPRG